MRRYLLLGLLLLVPTSLFAQYQDRARYYSDRDNSFEITPFVGYRWGGTITTDQSGFFSDDVVVKSSPVFGGLLSIPIGDGGFKVELMANRQSSELEEETDIFDPGANLGDIDITYYQVGARIPFAQTRSVRPFVVVSAGIANLDPHRSGFTSENRFAGSAGVGVKLPINRNLGFRFEGRGYYTQLEDFDENDCFGCDRNGEFLQGETSFGVVFSF